MKTKRCRTCGWDLQLAELPEFSGEAEGVRVTFAGLPCLACVVPTHPKRYPYPDFGADLIDAVYYSPTIPITRRTGILRTRHHCFACHTIIEASTVERAKVEGQIALHSLPPFTLIIEAPGVTCTRCHATHLYGSREVEVLVSEAMAEAFERVGLRP